MPRMIKTNVFFDFTDFQVREVLYMLVGLVVYLGVLIEVYKAMLV